MPGVCVVLLLALLLFSSIAAASPTYGRLAELWSWYPDMRGAVVDSVFENGVLYLLINNDETMVYAFNASTGSIIWASRVPGSANGTGLAVSESSVYVAALSIAGNDSVVTVYSGGSEGFQPLYIVTLQGPLYRVATAKPLPTGEIVVAGARFTAARGYQYFLGLYTRDGPLWTRYWGGTAPEIFNLVSVGPDQSVCAAGPPGGIACYTYDGESLFEVNTSLEPLAVLDIGSSKAVIAGVQNATGIIALLEGGKILWEKTTGIFIPTTLASGRYIIAAGAVAPAPYRLGVLILNTSGEPLLFGYQNETRESLLLLTSATHGDHVWVAGAREDRPIAYALVVLQAPPTSTTTRPYSGGDRLILLEEIALAAAVILLAVNLAVLKPWRYARKR